MPHLDSYGELARPLYKLMMETQQVQTNKLVWSPDTQKAVKALQIALLQAPTLGLPTGSKFSLLLGGGGVEGKAIATFLKGNCYYCFANDSILNGEGNGTLLQYSCLANPMDRGAW